MTSAKARGRKILAETRELAATMKAERERYWRALLARPQLAGPITHAVQHDLDAAGWSRRLACLVGFGRDMVQTRRAWQRDHYRRAVSRAAVWLASKDQRCTAANACHKGIELWADRQLPQGHRWGQHRLYPARLHSRAWRDYWTEACAAKRARETARNRIVVINEGLVISATSRWIPWATGHLDADDLMQAAREGMMTAADRYDTSKAAFSTYSMWWMRHKVFRLHQNERGDIRAPTAVQALAQQLADLVEQHPGETPEQIRERWALVLQAKWLKAKEAKPEAKLARTPTIEAVGRAMDYMGHHRVSFDQPAGPDGEGFTLADVLADPAEPADELIHADRVLSRLMGALDGMVSEDREVVTSLYGIDRPERTAREMARSGMGTVLEIERVAERVLLDLRGRLDDCG